MKRKRLAGVLLSAAVMGSLFVGIDSASASGRSFTEYRTVGPYRFEGPERYYYKQKRSCHTDYVQGKSCGKWHTYGKPIIK
jgi:hypothetical protein